MFRKEIIAAASTLRSLYCIPVDILTKEEFALIKGALTLYVVPYAEEAPLRKAGINIGSLKQVVSSDNPFKADKIDASVLERLTERPQYKLVQEGGEQVLKVPRFYGVKTFGNPPPEQTHLSNGDALWPELSFVGTLDPKRSQPEAVEAMLAQYDPVHGGGGILASPCGMGKTCMGCYIIQALGRKTAIAIIQMDFAIQFKEELERFIPDIRVSIINGKPSAKSEKAIQQSDVCIFILKSLSMYAYPGLDRFGTFVFDEVHVAGAEGAIEAIERFACKNVLGLSATPHRPDGMSLAIFWRMGEVAFKQQRPEHDMTVEMIEYIGPHKEIKNKAGTALGALMKKRLYRDAYRTQIIYDKLEECLREGRNIFVISDYIEEHLLLLKEGILGEHYNRFLKAAYGDDALTDEQRDLLLGEYHGQVKTAERERAKKCRIMLASYAKAAMSLNCPRLDTVILAGPGGSQTEQTVGRILRDVFNACPQNKTPKCIDIVDGFSYFNGLRWKRYHFYQSQHYTVKNSVVKHPAQEAPIFQITSKRKEPAVATNTPKPAKRTKPSKEAWTPVKKKETVSPWTIAPPLF